MYSASEKIIDKQSVPENKVEFTVGWLVGFLTSSSTTRLYRGRAPRQSVWQFYVLPRMRQSWETMTSVSAGHIILTPTQQVGSGRPLRESNPGPPQQESRALPLSYLPPPPPRRIYDPINLFERSDGSIMSNYYGPLVHVSAYFHGLIVSRNKLLTSPIK